MNIVFTGPAKIGGERVVRSLLIEVAEENGCYVDNAVTRATDFVVASSLDFKNRKGLKLRAADALGIPVITTDEFIDRIKNGGW